MTEWWLPPPGSAQAGRVGSGRFHQATGHAARPRIMIPVCQYHHLTELYVGCGYPGVECAAEHDEPQHFLDRVR